MNILKLSSLERKECNIMSHISIIIPVFNVEEYLPRCLDSLISGIDPLMKEIILIDDGSTDRSGLICDQYAKQHANVVVFHKVNGGVSSARNLGLDNASGDYVAFIDADDYVDEGFHEKLMDCALPGDFDLVVGDYTRIYPDGTSKKYRSRFLREVSLDRDKAVKAFLSGNRVGINLFDKLFKRSVIGNLRFDENIRIGEDLLFIFKFLVKANSIYCSNITGYNYVQRDLSAMNAPFSEKYFDVVDVALQIDEWAGKSGRYRQYTRGLKAYLLCKTVERAIKSNRNSLQNNEIKKYYQIIRNSSVLKLVPVLSMKRLCCVALMRLSPSVYLTVCAALKI